MMLLLQQSMLIEAAAGTLTGRFGDILSKSDQERIEVWREPVVKRYQAHAATFPNFAMIRIPPEGRWS